MKIENIRIRPRSDGAEVLMCARCRAFRGERVRLNTILVDSVDTVRVWDSIAGHFTACHSLTDWHTARIRSAARRAI